MEYLRSEMGKAPVLEGQVEIVGKINLFYQLQQLKNKCDIAESEMPPGITGADLTAMKEALNAQQQLLLKLYAELDQEREASETAASEALSMILRLQVEKAAVEMEAKQYKRMAEEKMFHANDCLGVLEDVVYQKDMEIAALECQIQAYKYKILSLGCYDVDCGENKNLESTFLRKIESVYGEGNSRDEEVSMNFTLPMGCPVEEREKAHASSIGWTENGTLLKESKSTAVDQELKVERAGILDIGCSYWQQIRRLDERVKGISNTTEFGRNNRRNSVGTLCSRRSINALYSCLDAVKKEPEILRKTKTIEDYVCSTGVQDIFEVPEVSASRNQSACVQCPISNVESKSEFQQLSMRIARLERASNGPNSRPDVTVVGAEDLGSLKESLNKIQTQLSRIQTDIKSLKTPKPKKHDDSVLSTIQEAMLHFWL